MSHFDRLVLEWLKQADINAEDRLALVNASNANAEIAHVVLQHNAFVGKHSQAILCEFNLLQRQLNRTSERGRSEENGSRGNGECENL